MNMLICKSCGSVFQDTEAEQREYKDYESFSEVLKPHCPYCDSPKIEEK